MGFIFHRMHQCPVRAELGPVRAELGPVRAELVKTRKGQWN